MFAKVVYRRPRLEAALSALDKSRLRLPKISLRALFPDFDQQPVRVSVIPIGPWSTPMADVLMLAKLAVCARPRMVLEVGSYRGYTALMLAEHLDENARVVTVDKDARHGEAYRGHEVAGMIERRVATVGPEAFSSDPPESYDLIFLDADHSYEAVKRDTEILLPLLAKAGFFVWHDYANWGRFSKKNGVPEYLHSFSKLNPTACVAGTALAIHSPSWKTRAGFESFRRALLPEGSDFQDPWETDVERG